MGYFYDFYGMAVIDDCQDTKYALIGSSKACKGAFPADSTLIVLPRE